MNKDAEYAAIKRMHDASLELGASCHRDCTWFGGAQDMPDDYDYGKSFDLARAQAFVLLSKLMN